MLNQAVVFSSNDSGMRFSPVHLWLDSEYFRNTSFTRSVYWTEAGPACGVHMLHGEACPRGFQSCVVPAS